LPRRIVEDELPKLGKLRSWLDQHRWEERVSTPKPIRKIR
jgi:hypothetical protein